MLARFQQFITLTLLAIAVGWVVALSRRGQPLVAVAGALLIVFGYAFVLAVEMLLSRRINRDDAVPAADAPALLTAWWGEVGSAARVFFWSQPFRSHAVPDRLTYAGLPGTGIVLVHGFVCNRGIWNPWLRRL